ncbi:hypothetical protein RD792_012526 [Penstemon davidsonii]|uniref:Strictosidine synthase conserved region domain-containing protein n=1 Tax=Penstemon davidsonii TaxID=160366 RepID=A0ABR0CXH7_9LAMI|nr:hypothetical protein RD792_012526 [Penstemon davidsonii]
MPAGLAVSKDGTFLLISEYSKCRITRFWVKGPKANTSETTFVELSGNPDNIKRTKSGDFWVAVVIQEWLPKKIVFPVGQKISAGGQILQTVNFFAEYNATGITEIHEHLGTYYVASLNTDFVVFGFNSFSKLPLPSIGSESLAFDSENGGVYTGLNDGRVVKLKDPKTGFVDFATTVSSRSKKLCDGTKGDLKICGKPIGLEFYQKTKELYVVDAYRGLFVVGKEGGVATQLSGGTHFDFADAIDIDTTTGVIYITDIGDILLRNPNMSDILFRGDDRGGRLLKYDPKTKKIDVLLKGLAMPAGLAISKDGSFVLIAEYLTCKITRFWIKGPKANTSETLVQLPGNPDNIKRTSSGDFWVAVNIQKLQPTLIVFPLGQKISAEAALNSLVICPSSLAKAAF